MSETAKIAAIRALVDKALDDLRQSNDWYLFIILPLYARHPHIPITGELSQRRWWFVLRPV